MAKRQKHRPSPAPRSRSGGRWANIQILELGFFGNGAPTSGQLSVVVEVPDTDEYRALAGTRMQLLVPNHSEADPETGPLLVCEASSLLMRAYMFREPVTLEWTVDSRGPWIVRIIAETSVEIPPPPAKA